MLSAILIGGALIAGPALRELVRLGEDRFEQRFAKTFGQLSGKDLPQGTLLPP